MRAPTGYPPDKLHQVLLESKAAADPTSKGKAKETDPSWVPISSSEDAATGLPRVVYEIKADSDRLEPRLRLLVNSSEDKSSLLPLSSITALENVSSSSLNGLDDTSAEPGEDGTALREGSPSTSSADVATEREQSVMMEGSEQVIELSCVT